ncbi:MULTISPECIES: marine proteobacterial sortase target protein [unclassified Wenzhouxiangella]|uniref:marine proteobacterial sortase target protein n=1 Tax=unclassified Wenzhouxiangella TaxID=2613841 RepID=UPI000E3266EF|nr:MULTISPECIES: marine proteobacterial sortase target protein [unclassified Wenzhouxiangella]RFF26741.1 marine proteobacterial sortase target protein [Wenzhouxiangella sp. 15181]RFP68927.1 marine proteobacterial sortase target protein [Wenzhouxiangella sp. 15190]
MSRLSVLLLLLVFGSAPATESGMWLERQEAGSREEALALATEVDIQVTGMLAMVEVRQRFFNQTGGWAEGVYRFPVPDRAAVEQLQIRLGQRLIEGEIQEREAARATYEAARDQGQIAGLVERDQGNLFSTRVANIPPGEMVEIRIGFTQPVIFEHGRFRLSFPTTAAPRFRPVNELERAVREQLQDAVGHSLPQRPVQLTVDLRPGLPLSDISSSHHAIDVEALGSDWLVKLADGTDWSGRDFELVWQPEDTGEAATAAFAESFNGHEHVMLNLVPPQAFEADDTPREVILVIDTSGSMSNEPIVQARESLHYALASLKPGDRFNVIGFNHQARSLYPQPRSFDEDRHVEATAWVDDLAAGGGTDMGPPLALALGAPPLDGYLRQVVFITDGMVGNERELLERTRLELGESRLFTVGIGHGVNGSFLRRLASAGRGSYTAIADTARIAGRMSELVLQLESPVIHDIEVIWPRSVTFYPETMPDLYVGQPLSIIARADRLSGDVIVRGTSNGQFFERVVPLEDFREAPGVASQWGRSRIEALENRIVSPAEDRLIESQVLDTALTYSLVSSQTSLVAVDRTPARSREAALRRYQLDTSPAHGRAGSLQAMPATDAGSAPAALRGALALLLVGLLLFQRRINRDEGDS